MNKRELSAMVANLTIMDEYSEAELRRRLVNEEDIVTFMATICWFITNTRKRENLSPFEENGLGTNRHRSRALLGPCSPRLPDLIQ